MISLIGPKALSSLELVMLLPRLIRDQIGRHLGSSRQPGHQSSRNSMSGLTTRAGRRPGN